MLKNVGFISRLGPPGRRVVGVVGVAVVGVVVGAVVGVVVGGVVIGLDRANTSCAMCGYRGDVGYRGDRGDRGDKGVGDEWDG